MIHQLLTHALKKAIKLPLDKESKYILFSDLHKGDNSYADDFAHNMRIYKEALHHYYINDYTYIELGDGIELWENRKIKPIIEAHQVIFDLLKDFHEHNRLYLLYGNHDMVMMYPFMVKKLLGKVLPNVEYFESVLLQAEHPKQNLLLIHGHQADYMNYLFWWLYRFMVRYVWKPLQLLGINDLTSPAKNFKGLIKVEQRMKDWILKNDNQPVIFGHTHRPRFPISTPLDVQFSAPLDEYSTSFDDDSSFLSQRRKGAKSIDRISKKEIPMFNVGSCVHPESIIGIEIENMQISMVKWSDDDDQKAVKTILEGPISIAEYW